MSLQCVLVSRESQSISEVSGNILHMVVKLIQSRLPEREEREGEARAKGKSDMLYILSMLRDEKEEKKKQARSNKQTRQSNTAHPRQHVHERTFSHQHLF